MARKLPIGRSGHFYGMPIHTVVEKDGTWLEPEEYAYPADEFTRRAYAMCEDGKLRLCLCKCADTYFSIPARCRFAGKYTKGFLSSNDEGGIEFTAFTDQTVKN